MSPVHTSGAPRPQSPQRAGVCWLLIFVIMLPPMAATVQAQAPGVPPPLQAAPVQAAALTTSDLSRTEVSLLVGRSTLLSLPTAITRVSLTSPDVADALVTTPQQVLIHGKAPGTISMFLWERTGAIRQYEVVVRRDLSELERQVTQLFPGEPITVASNGTDVVLSGVVSSKYVLEKAADVAAGYVEDRENVVNLLQQQQGVASNQVLLRVRFAEVSRSALQELGASFFTDAGGYEDWVGRTTTQQFAAPEYDDGKLVFSDFLNFFLFNHEYNAGMLIKALQNKGLFQSLAEPNLIAQNGKEASFLAGGEYPYPAVQGNAGNLAVSIVFKEFGIRLNFTPTVLGDDLIHLKLAPEVSALDFSNAVTLQGFRIPALSTRRTETEVELRDGQTFAIAGLLNNTLTETFQKVPGIGDIPILGLLFRSRALQKNQTELVIMVTPQIIRAGSTGVSPRLPDLEKPYLERPDETLPPPAPWVPQVSDADVAAPADAVASVVRLPSDSNGSLAMPVLSAEEREERDRAYRAEQERLEAEARLREEQEAQLAKSRAEEEKRMAKAREEEEKRMAKIREQEEKQLKKAREEEEKLRREEEKRLAKAREQEEKVRREEEKRLAKVRAEAEKRLAEVREEEEKQRREDEKQAEKARREEDKRLAEALEKQDERARKRGEIIAEAQKQLRDAEQAFQAALEQTVGED